MVSACQRHSFILHLNVFINTCIHFKCNIQLLLLISNINICKHGKFFKYILVPYLIYFLNRVQQCASISLVV